MQEREIIRPLEREIMYCVKITWYPVNAGVTHLKDLIADTAGAIMYEQIAFVSCAVHSRRYVSALPRRITLWTVPGSNRISLRIPIVCIS